MCVRGCPCPHCRREERTGSAAIPAGIAVVLLLVLLIIVILYPYDYGLDNISGNKDL